MILRIATPLLLAGLFGLAGCASSPSGDFTKALREGRAAEADVLIDQGKIEPNQVGSDGVTPLMLAAGAAQVSTVTLLLKKGANVNATDNSGRGAIHYATGGVESPVNISKANSAGRAKIIQQLVVYGSSLELKDRWGRTALHYSAGVDTSAHVSLVELAEVTSFLTGQGASVRSTTSGISATEATRREEIARTPLMIAAARGFDEQIDLLMKAGSEASKETSNGWTALHYAALKGADTTTLLASSPRLRPATNNGRAILASGLAYLAQAQHFAATWESEQIAEGLTVSADLLERAANKLTDEGPDYYGKDVQFRLDPAVLAIAYNILSFSAAYRLATIDARQMAAMSPSGRGIGVRQYQTIDPTGSARQQSDRAGLREESAKTGIAVWAQSLGHKVRGMAGCVSTRRERAEVASCISKFE